MTRALLAVFAIVMLGAPAAATEPADLASSITSELMSPWCPGVTVHDCPSPESMELRDQIERWAAAGWRRDRIIERLVDEYGAGILARPPARGAGLIAWILPIGAVAAGAIVAAMMLRRWTRTPASRRAPVASADERHQLERELAAYRSEA